MSFTKKQLIPAALVVAGAILPMGSAMAGTSTGTGYNKTCFSYSANSNDSQVTVKYTGANGCANVTQVFSLNAYSAQGSAWTTSGTQALLDHQSVILSASNKTATLTVKTRDASCFYQNDLYGSAKKYDGQDGALPHYPNGNMENVIDHSNGGSKVCVAATPTPTPTPTPTHTPTPTPKHTPTPTPTPGNGGGTPTPTPTPSVLGAATELPDTGAEAMLPIAAMSTAGSALAYVKLRRRNGR